LAAVCLFDCATTDRNDSHPSHTYRHTDTQTHRHRNNKLYQTEQGRCGIIMMIIKINNNIKVVC
jgi:hypothetical protein